MSIGATGDSDPNDEEIWRAAHFGAFAILRDERACDVAQDVVISFTKNGRNYYDSPLGAATVAGRNRAVSLLRSERRRSKYEESAQQEHQRRERNPIDQLMASLQVSEIMELARTELTPNEFAGLEALYDLGGTVNEAAAYVAERTGAKQPTARTYIRRAIAKIRAKGMNDE